MSVKPDLTCAKASELGLERGDSSGEGILKCETLIGQHHFSQSVWE